MLLPNTGRPFLGYWGLVAFVSLPLSGGAVADGSSRLPAPNGVAIPAPGGGAKPAFPTWIGFTPDNSSVVVRLSDSRLNNIGRKITDTVQVYDSSTGREVADWKEPGLGYGVANSSTVLFDDASGHAIVLGKRSVSVRGLKDWKTAAQEIAYPSPRTTFDIDVNSIWMVRSGRSMLLALVGESALLELWRYDRPFATPKFVLSREYDLISAIAVSKSGDILVAASKIKSTDKYIIDVVDVRSGRRLHSVQRDVGGSALSISEDDKAVVIGDLKGDLTLIDLVEKTTETVAQSNGEYSVSSMTIKGGILAYSVRGANLSHDVGVYSLKTKKHIQTLIHNKTTGTAIVAVSSDGKRCACIDYIGAVKIFAIQ